MRRESAPSAPLLSFSQDLHKFLKHLMSVMGTRGRLRMILDRKYRQTPVPHSLDGAVVQIDVRNHDLALERGGVDREAVVVSRDLNGLGTKVHHGLISAMMPELEFIGLTAQRQAQNLMAEADPEDRHAADEFRRGPNRVIDRLRIARAI